jgi:intraflagellar transport protein 172
MLCLCSGKLAAVTTDRVVYLFDDLEERKDKFKTKPGDQNGSGAYVVRGMAFSPDSTKLAIAQSDNIVFIYRCCSKSRCSRRQPGSNKQCVTVQHSMLVSRLHNILQLCTSDM